MSDRERLIEVMARAIVIDRMIDGCDRPQCACDYDCERLERSVGIVKQEIEFAIAAAERAGFEFRKKEVSDG